MGERRGIIIRLSTIFLAYLFVAHFFVPTATLAQPANVRYQRWDNRWEGIKSGNEVGGERLEPTSFIIKAQWDAIAKPSTVTLGFVAPRAGNVSVTVRIPDINYWMEPLDRFGLKRMAVGMGFNAYSWDGKCLADLDRRTTDLHAIALLRGATELPTYCPVFLYDNSCSQATDVQPGEYDIVFVSNAAVTIKYWFKDLQDKVLSSDKLEDMPEQSPFAIAWEPKGIPDGIYRLIIDATFPVRNKESIVDHYELRFVHKNHITRE